MDPNLFHLDWERTFEVLATVVLLSMLVERALAIVFENRQLIRFFSRNGAKELLAFGVAVAICVYWHFDAISMIVLTEQTTRAGEVATGAVIAGGSKGSIKLFRDWLGFHSSAWTDYQNEKARANPGGQPGSPAGAPRKARKKKTGGTDETP